MSIAAFYLAVYSELWENRDLYNNNESLMNHSGSTDSLNEFISLSLLDEQSGLLKPIQIQTDLLMN